jgi:hypothetical protein
MNSRAWHTWALLHRDCEGTLSEIKDFVRSSQLVWKRKSGGVSSRVT